MEGEKHVFAQDAAHLPVLTPTGTCASSRSASAVDLSEQSSLLDASPEQPTAALVASPHLSWRFCLLLVVAQVLLVRSVLWVNDRKSIGHHTLMAGSWSPSVPEDVGQTIVRAEVAEGASAATNATMTETTASTTAAGLAMVDNGNNENGNDTNTNATTVYFCEGAGGTLTCASGTMSVTLVQIECCSDRCPDSHHASNCTKADVDVDERTAYVRGVCDSLARCPLGLWGHSGLPVIYGDMQEDTIQCDNQRAKIMYSCQGETFPTPPPTPSPTTDMTACANYESTISCEWTYEHNCPGQPAGSKGAALKDDSIGYTCCCKELGWKAMFPTPAPPVKAQECENYMYSTGCDWTVKNRCPGQNSSNSGTAENDGSIGYTCCCRMEGWKRVCQDYMSQTGCGWTSEHSCPGQDQGSKGAAKADDSIGYLCCCEMNGWEQEMDATPPTPSPTPCIDDNVTGYGTMVNWWFGPNFIGNFHVMGDAKKCADMCDADADCAGFSRFKSNGHCYTYDIEAVGSGVGSGFDDSYYKCPGTATGAAPITRSLGHSAGTDSDYRVHDGQDDHDIADWRIGH